MWCFAGSANDMLDTGGIPNEIDCADETVPNIYFGPTLLQKITEGPNYFERAERSGPYTYTGKKVYEINGVAFNEPPTSSGEEYEEFEIETDMETSSDKGSECFIEKAEADENGESTYPGDDGKPLDALQIQNVHNDVIVNSNVYLTEKHWHTLLRIDEGTVLCAVCSTLCSAGDYQGHINSASHTSNLQRHLPLDYYDLCIMRKINGKYHCGVCNVISQAVQLNAHLATKSHEECLLSAINKVSDIMYEDRMDCHSPKDWIQASPNEGCLVEDDDTSQGFYDDYPTCSTNYGYVTIDEGFSYASKAGTPRKCGAHVEVDMDGRKAWVMKDAWHMILYPRPRKYYCMVCKTEGPKSEIAEHCSEEQHLANLSQCTVVKDYKHHLVRKIDHRYLHCAHCNNLQMLIGINDHLELKHPINRNKNLIDSQNGSTTSNNTTHTAGNGQNNGGQARSPSVPRRYDSIECKMFELNIFSNKLILPLLNYHMVMVSNVCHCVVCEVTFNTDLLSNHLDDRQHLERLNGAHFILGYACNLIRTVTNGLHCAICNALVTHGQIQSHIRIPAHISLMRRALSTTAGTLTTLTPNCEPSNQFSILNEITDSLERFSGTVTSVSKNVSPPLVDREVEATNFDVEALVHVRLGSLVARISACSYNTLVSFGDGARYCFLCSKTVQIDQLAQHVQRRDHQENLERNKFLEKSTRSLLRQIYVTYHCGVCNVLVTKPHLVMHLNWPDHLQHLQLATALKKAKKNRLTTYVATRQYEIIYTDPAEPQINIRQCLKFSKSATDDEKKSKIVIIKGSVAKIDWHAWNGFKRFADNGYGCLMCQKTLKKCHLVQHAKKSEHVHYIEGFLENYLPALIRTTHGDKLNCVTCNVVFKKHVSSVEEHISSKAHTKIYDDIMKNSVKADFSDCSEEAFTIGNTEKATIESGRKDSYCSILH